MHRIKHTARQNAWYEEDANFNPFARYRPRRAPGLRSSAEDGDPSRLPFRSETARLDGDHALPQPGTLQHAATSPETVSRLAKTASDDNIAQSHALRPVASLDETDSVQHKDKLPSRPASRKSDNETSVSVSKNKRMFTVAGQIRAILFGSWLNALLVFIPVGFAVNYTHLSPTINFAINFVAIVPSTMMISFAVDEVGLRTGDIIGALLNMTFSNATQLISSILLLRSRQVTVLKTSLLGSIISNLLLMLGLCFFCGGFNRMEQWFNVTVAQMVAGMLFLAIISLVVPTASRLMAKGVTHHGVVIQSRGTSIVILISYALYLFFQLKTHSELFGQPSQKTVKRDVASKIMKSLPGKLQARKASEEDEHEREVDEEDEHDEPQLSLHVAVAVLVFFTVLIGFNAEFATSSIQNMVQRAGISQTFVGFVILPILSNDVSSIVNAVKDKMDLSISLTLERCMQTALLVVPLVVLVAWGMRVEEMTLEFDGFSIATTFASIIIVTYVIQDGKSNWLIGALLIKVYVIVCLAAYFVQS